MPNLSANFGWALAVAAVAAGYAAYGWPGVAMGVSVVVFWLLLQFSQTLRLMRQAAQKPLGSLRGSAVMLHTQLKAGQRLADVMKLTGSFGVRPGGAAAVATVADAVADAVAVANTDAETYRWTDTGGDVLRVTLRAGKVHTWALERAESNATPPSATAQQPNA